MVRAAVLDDYQNVALTFADWSPITRDVEVKVFDKPFANQAEAIKALQGFAIIVGMRERTPFPRKVIEALPDLKLLITTGARNNSFDVKACSERGITVCGTGVVGSPDHRYCFRPDARIDPPDRFRERPPQGGRALAGDHRPRPRGPHARRFSAWASSASGRQRSARLSA